MGVHTRGRGAIARRALIRGEELTASQIYQRWGAFLGLSYQAIHRRVKAGDTGERLLRKPNLKTGWLKHPEKLGRTKKIWAARAIATAEANNDKFLELQRKFLEGES